MRAFWIPANGHQNPTADELVVSTFTQHGSSPYSSVSQPCSFGWWLVLICAERKVLLAGCWWLICSERKVLLAGG
jgi:hypothetical protein